jgi:hypothetical protein
VAHAEALAQRARSASMPAGWAEDTNAALSSSVGGETVTARR